MEKFQAIQPSALLAPYIRQYWFLSVDNIAQGSQRSMPTGSMGLLFNRGGKVYSSSENNLLSASYICGQSTAYTDLIYTETLDLILVVFNPIGARAFFKMPMNELRGQHVAIDGLSDPLIVELEDRLANTRNNEMCVSYIEQFLLKRIYQSEEYNYRRLIPVIQSINYGERDITRLAETACLSYKQFKRIFVEYVGLNPKDFLQITRFSRALHILQTPPSMSLNDLADECGYYDKSHLIKEIKIFSGYTPTEFLSNSDPYSDYKSLFQSFFIDTKY